MAEQSPKFHNLSDTLYRFVCEGLAEGVNVPIERFPDMVWIPRSSGVTQVSAQSLALSWALQDLKIQPTRTLRPIPLKRGTEETLASAAYLATQVLREQLPRARVREIEQEIPNMRRRGLFRKLIRRIKARTCGRVKSRQELKEELIPPEEL